MTTPRELSAELNDLMRSLRLTFDRRSADLELDERIELLSQIEVLRVVVRESTLLRHGLFFKDDIDRISVEIEKLRDIVAPLGLRFPRVTPVNSARSTQVNKLLRHGIPPYDLLDFSLSLIVGIPEHQIITSEVLDGLEPRRVGLSAIIPEQKISPVQFGVVKDVLSVVHAAAEPLPQDEANVFSARSSLVERGKEVLEELRTSNCDRRFLLDFEALQENLESSRDIIKLGILNLGCDDLRREFEAELSTAVSSKLRSHISSIAMYVAQFPEWHRFSENAAVIELSEGDIRNSQLVAVQIAEELEKRPDNVDPEVPRTLRLISDAIADPSAAKKRAAFALVRTVENLCIAVFGNASKFYEETSSKAIRYGSAAVALALSYKILQFSGLLTVLSESVQGMEWLKTAIEIAAKL